MHKKGLVEAILFMATRNLSKEEIESIAGTFKEGEFEEILEWLRERHNENSESGIMLDDSAGYRLIVKPQFIDKVRALSPYSDLSRGLLRTLAIVAYHEPVKQADIVKVIGNRTYEYIRELEVRGLVRARKEGRTKLVETTETFERYFGVTKEELKKMVGGNEADGKPGHHEDGGGAERS